MPQAHHPHNWPHPRIRHCARLRGVSTAGSTTFGGTPVAAGHLATDQAALFELDADYHEDQAATAR